MGMFATVYVDESIDLPHFPEELESDCSWQSKQGLDVYDGPYRITADGRLEKSSWEVVASLAMTRLGTRSNKSRSGASGRIRLIANWRVGPISIRITRPY